MQNADGAGETPAYANQVRRSTAVLSAGVVAWLFLTVAEATHVTDVGVGVILGLAGVLGPVALILTLAAGLAAWWLEPTTPWGVVRLAGAIRRREMAERLGVAVALSCCATVAAGLCVGAVGLFGLTGDGDWRRGAGVLAFTVLVTGVVLSIGVAWATRRLSNVLSLKTSLALVGLAVVAALLLVWTGETSGAGGVAGMWGVFRREELQLTLPCYLLVVLFLGYQLPWYLLRLPIWCGPLGASLIVACFGWSVSIASDVALQIEREAPLASVALKVYQKPFDRDQDGFASAFGGGDCDDASPERNPAAFDVPGNGLDEDCSGKDAVAEVSDERTGDAAASVGATPSLAASPTTPAPGASKPNTDDWNVLLITVDTLRFDLGFTGYHRPISPNIDALAKRATVYDNAYALASYTSKSLAPMMIGRYGSETNRGWMHFNKYPAQDRMVQERLKEHGVFTMSVQGHWYFKADTGLGRGFDVLDMSAAPTRPQGEGDKTVNSPALSDAAIKLLQEPARAEQRFFMWVHYLDPHAEYVRHAGFDFGSKGRERYDGEIAFTDFHIGRVLDALEQLPLKDRTVVVLTSDHGEAFGEHGLIRHGFELWEELVRVPFLVYVPGQPARHITERRSAIDIVPTLLDIFGVPEPTGDDVLSGKTLIGEWFGETPTRRDVFIDMPAGPYNGDRQAFISDDVKIITSNSRPVGVYDLGTDPGETKNLVKDAALTDKSLERMKAFRSKLRVVHVKPQ